MSCLQILEVSLQNKRIGVIAGLGGEAMVVNGAFDFGLKVTPKSVGDALGDFYNDSIDPLVDALVGEDMPGVPEVPDSWDKGFVISGYAEGGIGASLKGEGEFNLHPSKPTLCLKGTDRLKRRNLVLVNKTPEQ